MNQLFTKTISTRLGIIIVVLAALLAGGILAWQYFGISRDGVNAPKISVPKVDYIEGQEYTIKGIVLQNYTEGLPVDAPAELQIKTDGGEARVVYHPGEAECKNSTPIDLGLQLKSGDKVEVFGKFIYGVIRTCDSPEYYIKILDTSGVCPGENCELDVNIPY